MKEYYDIAAFPNNAYGQPGMSLRDYFAAKAMEALLHAVITAGSSEVSVEKIASGAYEQADAMLIAKHSA